VVDVGGTPCLTKAARAARIGAIRADSSATVSSNWRCCSVFAETGNSVLLERYGEMSAVPDALRGVTELPGDNGNAVCCVDAVQKQPESMVAQLHSWRVWKVENVGGLVRVVG
jgi:hypothetical protein